MPIVIVSTNKMSAYLLAEAVVNAPEGETIIVDTEHLLNLATVKVEQCHRTDLTIVYQEKDCAF